MPQMEMARDHSGTRSGASRYLRDVGVLRLVLLCDPCGTECQELGRVSYRPDVKMPELDGGAAARGGASGVFH